MDLSQLLSKLSAPAQRGLQELEATTLEDLTRVSENDLQSLHGVGPKAISVIKDALAAKGLTLQAWTEGKTVLTDPDIYPDAAVLAHHLGDRKTVLDQMSAELTAHDPPLSLEWRYYTDGNTWFGKVTAKSATIIWLMVCHHSFKTIFYFRPSALPLLEQSGLGDEYRNQFREIAESGKTKAVTVVVDGPDKLDHVRSLLGIKLSAT